MPKISVIVPVYNTEKYLKKCLNSIINQTYKDIEIIVVNDGATDNSENIILEYKKMYPDKIRYLKKENGGLSDARNFGVENATGEYLGFVDSDDYLDINLFDSLKQETDKKTELIKFKLIRVNENYDEIDRINGPIFNNLNGEEAFNNLVFKDILLEPATLYLYRREEFIKNKYKFEKNRYNEDFGLIPIVLVNARNVSSVNVYGYNYLQSNNSITRNDDYNKTLKSSKDLLFYYDNLLLNIKELQLQKCTINNLKQYYTNSILLITKKLKKDDQKLFIKEIKKRNLVSNIQIKNFKQLIKKIILKTSIVWYLNCI